MTFEQLEIIVKAIGVVIALIVTFIIKPLIESKLSETELHKLENYVRIAVRCAEQIYDPEEWKLKKLYVLEYASGLLGDKVDLELTQEQLDTLIEGLVNEVKHGVN